MNINKTFCFTDDEIDKINDLFVLHLERQNAEDNSGKYKVPKHWLSYQVGIAPRGGLYKQGVCACGQVLPIRIKEELYD